MTGLLAVPTARSLGCRQSDGQAGETTCGDVGSGSHLNVEGQIHEDAHEVQQERDWDRNEEDTEGDRL